MLLTPIPLMYLTYRESYQVMLYSYDLESYLIFRTKPPGRSMKLVITVKVTGRTHPPNITVRTPCALGMNEPFCLLNDIYHESLMLSVSLTNPG